MRKICAALLLSLICAVGLAGKEYPKPRRNQTPKKKPAHLYLVFTRDETTGEKRFGFIDNTGRLVIGFDRLRKDLVKLDHNGNMDWSYREGLICFCDYSGVEPLWGYMDRTGRVVIEPLRFHWAGPFTGGIAQVLNGGKSASPNYAHTDDYGYIDRTGKFIWQSSQSKATSR